MLEAPYSMLERLRRLTASCHGQVLSEEFAAEVILTLRFPESEIPAFQTALTELSSGALETLSIESSEVLMPISKNGPT